MFTRAANCRQPLNRLSYRRDLTTLGSLFVYAVGILLILILPAPAHAWQQRDDDAQEERQAARYSSNKTMPREGRPISEFERTRRGLIAARQNGLPAGSVVHLDAGPYTGTYTVEFGARPALGVGPTRPLREMFGHTTSEVAAGVGPDALRPRALPVGTRVRLAAGAYSGEYLRVAPGGVRPGRAIDIWVPDAGEAMRFGIKKATLVMLSACNPAILRNDLETKYASRKITEAEYKVKERELTKLENNFYPAAARLLDESGWTWQTAYSPNKTDAGGARQKSLADMFYERILLDLYRMRRLITEDEYEDGRRQIVQTTKELAREIAYNVADISDYVAHIGDFYRQVPRITPGDVRVLVESARSTPSRVEGLGVLAMPFVMLIGVGLTFYISIRKDKRETEKDKREIEQLKIQIRLNEVQTLEALERTKLLLDMKELQIEEMMFKIKELQSQAERDKKDLIVL